MAVHAHYTNRSLISPACSSGSYSQELMTYIAKYPQDPDWRRGLGCKENRKKNEVIACPASLTRNSRLQAASVADNSHHINNVPMVAQVTYYFQIPHVVVHGGQPQLSGRYTTRRQQHLEAWISQSYRKELRGRYDLGFSSYPVVASICCYGC